MKPRRKPWMQRIAPWSPFLVLAAAVAVAAHHVIFNW